MKQGRYILLFFVLTVAQILLCNYFSLSRIVLISVLPVLILMLPRSMSSIPAMLIAFACGFAVDFLSTGMLGITSLALVPVALVRRPVLQMVLAEEQVSRDDELSLSRFGVLKMVLAILISCAIFLLVYIWADSAGTVGFWPAVGRFFLSLLVDTLLCVLVARLIRPE